MGISSYNPTAALNISVSGISIAEGMAPSLVNDAIRAVLADLAVFSNGQTVLGTAASQANSFFAQTANNLSDLANAATARTNLGVPLGTSGAVVPLLNGANTWSATQAFAAITASTTAGITGVLTAGGVAYPTSNGTSGQFLQTNGSGTASWASTTAVYTGGSAGVGVAQNTTNYMWNGVSSGGSDVYTILPSGTLGNLKVKASTSLPAGQTAVFTLRKNGVATAITCTITGTADTASDTTHTVAAAGEVYDIQIVTSATTGTIKYNFSMTQTIP